MTMPVEHLLPVQSLLLTEEAPRETAAVAATPGPPYTLHTIAPGDTLWDIAHR
jgi:nucleoid-associated protein YgaU